MFGDKLRDARKSAKITQEYLAEQIGVKRSVISKYENGIVDPSIAQVERIASALGVAVGQLLGQPDPSPLSTDEFNAFERFIEELGYHTRLEEDGCYRIQKGGQAVCLSVDDFIALVRSSRATVGALVQDLIDHPPEGRNGL